MKDIWTQFGGSLNSQSVDAWAPESFYRLFDDGDQDWVRKVLPPHKLVEHLHSSPTTDWAL